MSMATQRWLEPPSSKHGSPSTVFTPPNPASEALPGTELGPARRPPPSHMVPSLRLQNFTMTPYLNALLVPSLHGT